MFSKTIKSPPPLQFNCRQTSATSSHSNRLQSQFFFPPRYLKAIISCTVLKDCSIHIFLADFLSACYYFLRRLIFLAVFVRCTICAIFFVPCDIWFVLIFITYSAVGNVLWLFISAMALRPRDCFAMMCNGEIGEGENNDDDRSSNMNSHCTESPWKRQWNAAKHLSPAEYLCWWWQT